MSSAGRGVWDMVMRDAAWSGCARQWGDLRVAHPVRTHIHSPNQRHTFLGVSSDMHYEAPQTKSAE